MKKKMMMAFIALVAITGYSESTKETKEPAELTAARKDYAAQVEKATAPIKAKLEAAEKDCAEQMEKATAAIKVKQVVALQKLQASLMKRGDAQGVAAVQAEIGAVDIGSRCDLTKGGWTFSDPGCWSHNAVIKKKGDKFIMDLDDGGSVTLEFKSNDEIICTANDGTYSIFRAPENPNKFKSAPNANGHSGRVLLKNGSKDKR